MGQCYLHLWWYFFSFLVYCTTTVHKWRMRSRGQGFQRWLFHFLVFAFPNFLCVTFLGVGEARWLWRKTGRKSNKERRRRTTSERMINLFDLITKIWTMATFFIACTNLNVMKLTHYWKKIFHKLHQRQWYRKSESESWNNEKRMWGYFRPGGRGNEKHYQVKSENIIWNNFGRNDY